MTGSQTPTAEEIRRWSEEVARDPASPAFHPLARAYFDQGRRDAAERLCIRGLERHPEHVDAHVLLGRVYRAADKLDKAFDEWDIALRLDPAHPTALREIARLSVERRDWATARRHLERALAIAPEDGTLQRLVEELEARLGRPAGRPAEPEEPAESGEAGVRETSEPARAEPDAASGSREARPDDFGEDGGEGIIGAILFDDQGFLVAGRFRRDEVLSNEVAAALAGSSDDVGRAVRHLDLGDWDTVLLETSSSTVHLTPVGDAMLAVAGTGDVPIGWVMRTSARLRKEARALLGLGPGGGRG